MFTVSTNPARSVGSTMQRRTRFDISGGRMNEFCPNENDVSEFFSVGSSLDGSPWRNRPRIALRARSASSISVAAGTYSVVLPSFFGIVRLCFDDAQPSRVLAL